MSAAAAASPLVIPDKPKPRVAAAESAPSFVRDPIITFSPALAQRRASAAPRLPVPPTTAIVDRNSVVEGKSVSVGLDLGCRLIIKKKNTKSQSISTKLPL